MKQFDGNSKQGLRNFSHKAITFIRSDKANTAEENTNRGFWWIGGILIVGVVIGVAWYVVGNGASQAQHSGTSVITSASSQSGLNNLTTQAEGNSYSSTQTQTGGTFKGPSN